MITIKNKNTTYHQLEVQTENEFRKIFDFFSVKIPGAEFIPSVKMGLSDGKQKFITPKGELPWGLKNKLINFCNANDLQIQDNTVEQVTEIDIDEFKRFITLLDLPFEPYPHQVNGAYIGLTQMRKVILSATGSGKSLLIYIMMRYFISKDIKTMLIVPTIDLVNQMYSDFEDYFYSKEKKLKSITPKDEYEKAFIDSQLNDIYNRRELTKCSSIAESFHRIFGGQDKHTSQLIKISTYQSLSLDNNRVDSSYFSDMQALIIDECHKASSKTIKDILQSSDKAGYKIGLTGSLSPDIIENLTIEGLLGSVVRIISMREMIDLGLATEIVIKPLFLKYPKEVVQYVKPLKYQEEDKFIRTLEERAKFLARICCSFKDKNVMLIYKNIDTAELILKYIHQIKCPEEPFDIKVFRKQNPYKVYYSQGDTKSAERNNFRGYLEESEGCILLGTTSIIATGLNIKKLDVTIFESIGKSNTLTIQGLGRGARLHHTKSQSTVFDIVDDCRYYSKTRKEYPNYKYEHWLERLDIYYAEEYIVDEPVSIEIKMDIPEI